MFFFDRLRRGLRQMPMTQRTLIPLTPTPEPDAEEGKPDLSLFQHQQDALLPGQMLFEPFENIEVLASPENCLILGLTEPLSVEVGDGSWRVGSNQSTDSMPVVRINKRAAAHLIYRLQEYVRNQ